MKQCDLCELYKNHPASAPSFPTLLAVLFIGLKLGGVIDWSWVWVLSPLWIVWVIAIILLAFAVE